MRKNNSSPALIVKIITMKVKLTLHYPIISGEVSNPYNLKFLPILKKVYMLHVLLIIKVNRQSYILKTI